jgi:hypothetical protein
MCANDERNAMSPEPNSVPKRRRYYWIALLLPGIASCLIAALTQIAPMPRGSENLFGFFALVLALVCGPVAAYRVAKQTKFRYENKALLAILLTPVFTVVTVALTIPGCAAMPVRFGG